MEFSNLLVCLIGIYSSIVPTACIDPNMDDTVISAEIVPEEILETDTECRPKPPNELRIAWLAPKREYHNFSAASSVGALKLALHSIGKEQYLYNKTVRARWYDTDCDSKRALAAAVDAVDCFDPDVFIGPPCSQGLSGVAQLCSHWNLPVFSWVSDLLNKDKDKYTTLVRLCGPLYAFSSTVMQISYYFSWNNFALIYDKLAPYEAVALSIRELAEKRNYTINSAHYITTKTTDLDIETMLLQIRKFARVILFVVPWHMLRNYLLIAHALGMENGEFAFVCVHGDLFTWDVMEDKILSDWGWRRNDTHDDKAREIFESVIHIIVDPLKKEKYEGFQKWTKAAASINIPLWENLPMGTVSDAYAPYLFDATMIWARAVNLTLAIDGNPRDGELLYKMVPKAAAQSVTGDIVFNEPDRDRIFNYQVLDMTANGTFYKLFHLEFKLNRSLEFGYDSLEEFKNKGRWPTRDGKPPLDWPECGFDGEKCIKEYAENYNGTIIGASISASVVIILAIVVHLMLRRYRRQQFLQGMLWQVKFEEIDFVTAWITGSIRASFRNLSRRKPSSKAYRKGPLKPSVKGRYSLTPDMRKKRASDNSPEFVHQKSLDPSAMFGSVAFVRGNMTSVKRAEITNLSITNDVIQELNQLMEMKNQNVCAFVGACLDSNRAILLWEYCAKGSLHDVIWNQNIKLDKMFMFALSHDVAKGLEYIHKSSVHFHGNLRSTNCVVDGRWTCKLTDFGVPKIRDREKVLAAMEYDDPPSDKMLWLAPESLRENTDVDVQKADIFALGIILKEIFTRSGPYTEYPFLVPHEIVEKVKHSVPGGKVFRPMIALQLRQYTDLTSLIEDCWSEEPASRPSAGRVLKTLNRINPQNLSMMDNMILMLEKYANHLEELVAERTSELDAEKMKAENLLYRMLPQTVAEELKSGRPIKAEQFEDVTIYFSDICGFTNICANSTPIEVVNLLNSLYTLFDDIITRYDVYKVETIGDAYMIASGLPKRNGKKHIQQMADCALDILASVCTFYIPHQPDKNLRIRIGIHTGPVVAGVVGLSMPRYCLFGDTVNTASRMESTGLPLRIHMSAKSKKALHMYTGYHLHCRGEITVKGKGVMKTYLLCGKDGFEKELPKWDDIDDNGKSDLAPRPSVTSYNSTTSFNSCGSSNMTSQESSVSLSDIWDERYKSKQTSILEVTCL